MSMTPDQILQLPTFGKIPAETNLADIRTAFAGETVMDSFFCRNWTGSVSFSSSSSAYSSEIDISDKLASFVTPTRNVIIWVILTGRFTGAINYACKYTDGLDADITTKTQKNGDNSTNYNGLLGGGVFQWTCTQQNLANNAKFQVGLTTTGAQTAVANIRATVLGFPVEYGGETGGTSS